MEFDLDYFMTEVTAALQCAPPRPGKRRRDDESDDAASRDGNTEKPEKRISVGNQTQPSDSLILRQDRMLIGSESGNETDDVIDIPSENIFCPDLDMTTAILACRSTFLRSPSPEISWLEKSSAYNASLGPELIFNPVPNFYSYAITACLLPIRKVQHELISLYFHYIHPMLPIVDEHHFTQIHQKYRGKEQMMDSTDFMIYQAIMAAGFGHLSESQLKRTPYRSVHEGQEAQFDQVKARYWSQPTTDPLVLTQISLIISLWSPSNPGAQNNSYWLNLAFKHATIGQLWKPQPGLDGRQCRRRLLWWCCLVRDRVLALGMRRPYRLHKAPQEEDLISQADFGLEARYPSYTDVQSKKIAIWAFIWLCRLSEIMAAIAVFQRQNRFSREWNGETAGDDIAELQEATKFDEDIRKWKTDFEHEATEVMRSHYDPDALIPVSILRIVSSSILAYLYQPYLHLSGGETLTAVRGSLIDPLQRVKEGCQAVESSVMTLLSDKKSDSLPNWLVAWVGLPTAVYHVSQQVVLNSSPDRVLMPCLNRFMRRTTGAQAVFLVLTKATKEFLQELSQNSQEVDTPGYRRIAPSTYRPSGLNAMRNTNFRITEAKVLAHVTKALDFALELNC